ncbi:glycoside hydrolase family 19 protein [Ectopseudomonas khazarica]|uniref:glycoside hydrolase family 19 protein n=1 Tax=Ectopseudomonas khazarica TaxID=2502979 RepID=UPI00384DCF7D
MEGNDISGWAPEKDLIVTRHSPWEWPGFSTLRDNLSLDAHLARTLDATGRATEEETASYAALIEEAERGTILSKLYEIIDQPDEKGVRDNKLTPAEFQAALAKPWLAQQLSLLISQHESEWFWNESKWNQLDTLMEHTPEDPNIQWVREKERIKKLSWWKELAGQPGIVADGVAWHFQPIILLSVLVASGAELISSEIMKEIFPSSQDTVREEVRTLFNKYATLFEVNTPERISQFFAQVKAEVGDALVGKEESLWYSTEALKSKFGRYFSHYPQEAEELGYKRISLAQYNTLSESAKSGYRVIRDKAYSQLPQEDEIAKRIYCCSVPGQNFHLNPGGCSEGLSYKGKGSIQLTWKENYKEVERLLKAKIPNENINIVANPDQVLETKYGLLSALGFWEWKRLNAKSGNSTAHTDEITKIVNLHTDSYGKRRENFEFIYGILKSD